MRGSENTLKWPSKKTWRKDLSKKTEKSLQKSIINLQSMQTLFVESNLLIFALALKLKVPYKIQTAWSKKIKFKHLNNLQTLFLEYLNYACDDVARLTCWHFVLYFAVLKENMDLNCSRWRRVLRMERPEFKAAFFM
jgi:hypothetical protein